MFKIQIEKEFEFVGDAQHFLREMALELNTGRKAGENWKLVPVEGAESGKNEPGKQQTALDDRLPGNYAIGANNPDLDQVRAIIKVDHVQKEGVKIPIHNGPSGGGGGMAIGTIRGTPKEKVDDKSNSGIWPWQKKKN